VRLRLLVYGIEIWRSAVHHRKTFNSDVLSALFFLDQELTSYRYSSCCSSC